MLALSALALLAAAGPAAAAPARTFTPLATFPVDGAVAGIISATPDGRTVVSTDSELGRVGLFLTSNEDDGSLSVFGLR